MSQFYLTIKKYHGVRFTNGNLCSYNEHEVILMYETELLFDYAKEPSRDILCIDCKSFYASVECADIGKDPLTTELVEVVTKLQ